MELQMPNNTREDTGMAVGQLGTLGTGPSPSIPGFPEPSAACYRSYAGISRGLRAMICFWI